MKKFFEDKENRIFIAVIIITLIVAALPLFSKYCILGHDSDYHLLRIEALKEGILKGVPFLKINVLFFGGAGYASSMFYPDFLLYIPALLRVLHVSINASFHLFIFICIALSFVSAFFSVFFMTKNKYAALISGVLFTLCSYHLDDIYVRAAVGEYTAFIFLPVFLYGVYNVCFEDMDKPQLLLLSLAGILLCHTLSFVLCIIITAVILIANYKAFLKNKKLIIKLIEWACLTILITAYYLFPMLEQLLSDKFYVSYSWIEPAQSAMQAADVFGFLFPTIGAGLLLFIFPRLIIKKDRDDVLLKFADECIIIGIILAVASTDLFPWNRIGKYVSTLQFPWRLFQVSSVLLAMAGAVVLYKLALYLNEKFKLESAGQLLTIIVLIVMVFTSSYSFTKQEREYYDFSNDYYDYKPFTASVIAGEWLPTRVRDAGRIVDVSDTAYSNDGSEYTAQHIKNTIRIAVKQNVDEIPEYIDVPFIYYKGYAAKTDSGQMLRVDGNADNGFTRVYLDGNKNNFTVYYKGTVIQHISTLLSLVTFICLIACFVIRKNKLKKNN